MSKDIYESPLASRYASKYMLHLFSPDMRFQTWRRLWVELARAEHDLGLPITAEQVAELEAHVTDIDYAAAEQRAAKDRGHSTTADAAKAALKAGARRLVIGHYSSRYKDEMQLVDEARTIFPESYPATEGTTYSIEKER